MLPLLLLSNLRLVVYLFGALVFAAMSWLYFDALFVRTHKSVWLRAVGALLISLSYLAGAVMVEGLQIQWVGWLGIGVMWMRVVGYLVLALGVWGEPLSKRPGVAAAVGSIPTWVLPLLPATVGLGYWRRASVGLERHLYGMAKGMYVLSLAEVVDLRRLFVGASDIRLYEWVREFGVIWQVQLCILLVGFVLISKWVFSYLLRRFETQITLFMGMLVMSVFAVATCVFTYVMANRLQSGAEREVNAGVKIMTNNWGREGDELKARMSELMSGNLADKEALAKSLQGGEYILDTEARNVLSGEKMEGLIPGVGYRLVGIGSSRRVELTAVGKHELGYVVVSQNVGEWEQKSAEEIGMAIRLYDGETVIGASSVPGYPEIASPLGLTRKTRERLGGVAYTSGWGELKNAEGVTVAKIEVAQPLTTLWNSVGQALFWTYLAGVVVLLFMELPAVLMAHYLTRQLR